MSAEFSRNHRAECRQRSQRGRRLKSGLRSLLIVLAPTLLLGLGWKIFQSVDWDRHLDLRTWSMHGLNHANEATARSLANALMGQPMSDLDLQSLETALEEDPWVMESEVLRCWPNGMRVRLKEEKAIAFVMQGARVLCLKEDGSYLPWPLGPKALSLPVLEVSESMRSPREVALKDAARSLEDMRVNFPALFADLDCLTWSKEPRLRFRASNQELLLRRDAWQHGLSKVEVLRRVKPELLQEEGLLDLRFTNQVIRRKHV
jgi:hypothetical protein